MGIFDDLLEPTATAVAEPPKSTGIFDDLVGVVAPAMPGAASATIMRKAGVPSSFLAQQGGEPWRTEMAAKAERFLRPEAGVIPTVKQAESLSKRFGKKILNSFAEIGQSIISSPLSPIGIPGREAQKYKQQAAQELDQAGFQAGAGQAAQLIETRAAKLAAGERIPAFDVKPPQTAGQKVTDIGAGLTSFIAQLALMKKVLPKGTPDAVIWEVQNQLSGGVPGQGLATRTALGQIGKIPTGSLAGKSGKVIAESALFGGVTAAMGGSTEDIIVSALVPPVFNTWSFARQKYQLTGYERHLRQTAEANYNSRKNEINRTYNKELVAAKRQSRRQPGISDEARARLLGEVSTRREQRLRGNDAALSQDAATISKAVNKAKRRIYNDDAFAPAKEKWDAERQKALRMVASGKPDRVKHGRAMLDFMEIAQPSEGGIKMPTSRAGEAIEAIRGTARVPAPQKPLSAEQLGIQPGETRPVSTPKAPQVTQPQAVTPKIPPVSTPIEARTAPSVVQGQVEGGLPGPAAEAVAPARTETGQTEGPGKRKMTLARAKPAKKVTLFRAMTKSGYDEWKRTGVISAERDLNVIGGNVRATNDYETAKYYASVRGEGARVVRFEANLSDVSEVGTQGNFKFINDVKTHEPGTQISESSTILSEVQPPAPAEVLAEYPDLAPAAEAGKGLPPHLQSIADKAKESKVTITDVTPEGYGPSETEEPVPSTHLTTEQQRLRSTINEAKTILKGEISGEKRKAIERSLIKAEKEYEVITAAVAPPAKAGEVKWLSAKVRYENAVMTEREYLDRLIKDGYIATDEPKQGLDKYRAERGEDSFTLTKQEFGYLKNKTEKGAPSEQAEKEAITEPEPGIEEQQRKAGEPVSLEPTGKLDPAKAEDAKQIVKLHQEHVVRSNEGRTGVGGIFTTTWSDERRQFVVDKVDYTIEQVDAAYRTLQTEVPTSMSDVSLFAMPGKEKEVAALGQKMARMKAPAQKKPGVPSIGKPSQLPKVGPTKEAHIKAVYSAAARAESRFAINGVNVEGDNLVATDGHRLFIAKGKWGKDGLYLNKAALSKGLLGKPDTTGEVTFPKWRDIMPDYASDQGVVVDDLPAMYRRLTQAEALTTEESKGVAVILNKDGSLGFASASPEVGHAEINVQPGGKILGAANPSFLKDALAFHAVRGDKQIEFYFPYPDRPILTTTSGGKTQTITMPVSLGRSTEELEKSLAERVTENKPVEQAKPEPKSARQAPAEQGEGKATPITKSERDALIAKGYKVADILKMTPQEARGNLEGPLQASIGASRDPALDRALQRAEKKVQTTYVAQRAGKWLATAKPPKYGDYYKISRGQSEFVKGRSEFETEAETITAAQYLIRNTKEPLYVQKTDGGYSIAMEEPEGSSITVRPKGPGLTKAEMEHLGKREQQALIAGQELGGDIGFKAGEIEGLRKARTLLDEIKLKAQLTEKYRQDVKDIIKQYVPKGVGLQGRLIRKAISAKTNKQIDSLITAVKEQVDRAEQRILRQQITKMLKSTRPRKVGGRPQGKLTPEVQRRVDFLRRNITRRRAEILAQMGANIEAVQNGTMTPIDMLEANQMLNLTGLRGMTVAEMRNAHDNIKGLIKDGKLKHDQKIAEMKEIRDQRKTRFMELLTGKKGLKEGAELLPERQTEKRPSWLNSLNRGSSAWDNLMDYLSRFDKGSKPYQSILSQFGDLVHISEYKEAKGIEEYSGKIHDGFAEVFGVESPSEMWKIIHGLAKQDINLGTFTDAVGRKITWEKLSKLELIKRYMELQDPTLTETFNGVVTEEGKQYGMHWTEEMKNAVLGNLNAKEKAWGDWLLNFYRGYYDSINEIYKQQYFIDLPKNDYYSPINRMVEQDNPEETLLFREVVRHASVTNPSLITRVKNMNPLRWTDANKVLMNHVMRMEHFKHWAETMHDLRSIFSDAEIRKAVKQYHGRHILQRIDVELDEFSRGGINQMLVNNRVDRLRRNFTTAALVRPAIAPKQIPSILSYLTEMPIKDFMTGIAKFWMNPIKNTRLLMEMSPIFKESVGGGYERDVRLAMHKGADATIAHHKSFRERLFAHIRLGDYLARGPGQYAKWLYEKKLRKSPEDAMREAEKTTGRTQPGWKLSQLSAPQKGGSVWKLFTMFQTQPIRYYSMAVDNARNAAYGRGSRFKALSNLAMIWVVMPMLFNWIADAFQWKSKHQAVAVALGPFGYIPIAGKLITNIALAVVGEAYGSQLSPIQSIPERFQRAASAARRLFKNRSDSTKDATVADAIKIAEELTEGIGYWAGLPTPYIIQIERAARKLVKPDQKELNKRLPGWRRNPAAEFIFSPYSLEAENQFEAMSDRQLADYIRKYTYKETNISEGQIFGEAWKNYKEQIAAAEKEQDRRQNKREQLAKR